MQIPVSAESTEQFIGRIAKTLLEPGTHIYFDASFLMWLTAVSSVSRKEFFDWASTLKGRCHVPSWAAHEFYGHHSYGTLQRNLNKASSNLVSAIKSFAHDIKPHADRQLLPGRPQSAYREAFRTTSQRLQELVGLAGQWNYEGDASETISWMNAHACDVDSPFKMMTTLRSSGRGRFMQRVPPGFEDGDKQERGKRGSNRFGDLVFWEEVLAHAQSQNATAVVIVTNDRKKDWYFRIAEAEVGTTLRRLRPRWDPVPAPHPSLTFELKTRMSSAGLDLLDQLYLGAVIWHDDKTKYGRFANIAMDLYGATEDQFAKPATPAVPPSKKRLDASTIGIMQADGLVKAAFAKTDATVDMLLAKLDGEIVVADSFVESFSSTDLNTLDPAQTVAFARELHDRAASGSATAERLSSKLLGMLGDLPADTAACTFLGLAISTYYAGEIPRDYPKSHLLDELFTWQSDTALANVEKALGRRLRRDRSPVFYIPNPEDHRISVIISHDTEGSKIPADLRQVHLEGRALLRLGEPRAEHQLRAFLEGRDQATIEQIVRAISLRYGIPLDLIDVSGGKGDELRSIPELMGFMEFDRFDPQGGDVPVPTDVEVIEEDDLDEDAESDEEEEGE